MIYHTLAHVYDALVKDDEATQAWVDFIKKHVSGKELLEVACGSGEITIALSKQGYQIHASDLSADMIEEAKKKAGSENITWSVMDMSKLNLTSHYDGILCLCDSFNYLLEPQEVQQFFLEVHDHLSENGLFFFDTHSLDRLQEFQEEFNETGHIFDVDYQWSITSEENYIYQDFAFYKEDGTVIEEHHMQRVYDPAWLIEILELYFTIEKITTDFDQEGIQEGEKYFFVCRRK